MHRLLLVALTAVACVACTSPAPDPAAGTTAASSAAPDVRPLPDAGDVPPGTYRTDGFAPAVTFELAGSGWSAEQRAAGFLDVEQDVGSPDVVAVQLALLEGATDIDEALVQLTSAKHVVAGTPEQVDLAGTTATRVLLETDDPPTTDPPVFRPVLRVAAGPVSIASGRRLLVHLVGTPDGVLAVLLGGSVARWDHAVEVGTPVVASVRLT